MRALALVLGIIVGGCAAEGRSQPETTIASQVTGSTAETSTTVVPSWSTSPVSKRGSTCRRRRIGCRWS